MDLDSIQTIDAVIEALQVIIDEAKAENSPYGYFPALYQKVTIKVREGIKDGFFENGSRMEKLDIVFAKRYLAAYQNQRKGRQTTQSWEKAFQLSEQYWPIVLQHLLMGMNAHINLDLGLAAAEISTPENIQSLQTDFQRINQVLANLVEEVQEDLAKIWPSWHWILRRTGRIDNYLIDFSMEVAREGAWQVAQKAVRVSPEDSANFIEQRDSKVANFANTISQPAWLVQLALRIIRIGERGTVVEKITALQSP
ncbi:MAG: hypothetical protein HRU41_37680 [Saprospiraceae bacterium]|nr:hypothetical protein [Saprospiraceae bacterium]